MQIAEVFIMSFSQFRIIAFHTCQLP